MIRVTLTWPECEQAAYAGMKRQLLNLYAKRPDRYGFNEPDPWGTHIESAAAELAVARQLDLYWSGWAKDPKDVLADVGENVQVRRSQYAHGHLLLHRADEDDHCFVLVYGQIPNFDLLGWVYGHEGKDERFWGDPHKTGRPAFWIPQPHLHDMESPMTSALAMR